MKNIIFLRRTNEFGGCEILLLDWLKYIDYRQYKVVLASTTDYFSEKIAKIGLPVRCVTIDVPFNGTFWETYNKWHAFLNEMSPDEIVIMQGGFFEFPLPCVLAAYRSSSGNLFMTEHLAAPVPDKRRSSIHFGFIPGIGLWWYKMMWGLRIRSYLSKRILAVSREVKSKLQLYGYPPEKISVAYHGVDTERFSPSEIQRKNLRQLHKIPDDGVVIVSTARLSPQKKIDRLIKAHDVLSQRHDNLWLLIAGDGPLREEINNLVDTTNGKEKIKLLGQLEDVTPILQASDIYVLSSDNEGLSVALTEAMSVGLVSIASNVSGSNEVLEDEQNGFLVDPSYDGILGGMEKAIHMDPEARRILSGKARQTIIEKFSTKKSVKHILELMDIESVGGITA